MELLLARILDSRLRGNDGEEIIRCDCSVIWSKPDCHVAALLAMTGEVKSLLQHYAGNVNAEIPACAGMTIG